MSKSNARSLGRYELFRLFNIRFFNHKFYDTYNRKANGNFLIEYEDNRSKISPYLDDAIDLCLNTDICKKTNMSLSQLMQLDLATYNRLKEKVVADAKRTAKQVEKMQKESELLKKLKE